jgi:choline dehydrogenase-like flavoprotein
MPKNPPNLARLIQSADPADRVQVQQTDFAYDVMARYTCNDWAEVQAALTDGGFPFDAVVIGCGMLGGFIAEKLFHAGAGLGFRILVLEAGAFALPTHIQNLPQRLGGSIGGPAYTRKRDDASGVLRRRPVAVLGWVDTAAAPRGPGRLAAGDRRLPGRSGRLRPHRGGDRHGPGDGLHAKDDIPRRTEPGAGERRQETFLP